MDELFGYVFGRLKTTEDALRKVGHVMKCQNAINRKLAIGVALSGVGLIITLACIQEQSDKIAKLNYEIEKLKNPEPTEGNTESE